MTTKIVKIPHGVLCSPVANEAVLLELESGRYFGLNEVGARVWALLQQEPDLGSVEARLIDEYEVDPETLRRDLQRLVDELVQAGLLQVETAPTGAGG